MVNNWKEIIKFLLKDHRKRVKKMSMNGGKCRKLSIRRSCKVE